MTTYVNTMLKLPLRIKYWSLERSVRSCLNICNLAASAIYIIIKPWSSRISRHLWRWIYKKNCGVSELGTSGNGFSTLQTVCLCKNVLFCKFVQRNETNIDVSPRSKYLQLILQARWKIINEVLPFKSKSTSNNSCVTDKNQKHSGCTDSGFCVYWITIQ